MPMIHRPLVLAFASTLAAQALPVPARGAEDLLPTSVYATLRFGGLAACRDAAAGMPVAAAVKAFLENVPAEVRTEHVDERLELAARHLQQHCEDLALRPADVQAVLGRPMTLALGRLTIDGFGPSVALLVETGGDHAAIERIVDQAAVAVTRAAGGGTPGTAEVGGNGFRTLLPKEGPMLYAGPVGGCYVVSNSAGLLGEIAAVAAGRQPALGTGTRLGALRSELGLPALGSLFVNTARLMASLEPHLPYEAEQWSAALGLGAVDALYYAVGADPRGGADLLHIGVGGSEKGLLKALLAAPADLSFARSCSANTVVFASASCDVGAVVAAFERVLEVLPPAARVEIERELRREAGAGALEHVAATAGAFGTQIGFAVALEKGAVPKPELLVRVGVRDAEAVRALLQRGEAAASEHGGVEWRTRAIDGHELRFCNLQLPEAGFQLSPCYALAGDSLWLASDTAALARALRQDPETSLAAQADYGELAQTTAGASAVLHCRLFRAAEIGWRTVETMVYPHIDARRDQLGFGAEALPDTETMAAALGSLTTVYRVDDDGVSAHSRGLLTYGAMLAGLGHAVDEVFARAGARIY